MKATTGSGFVLLSQSLVGVVHLRIQGVNAVRYWALEVQVVDVQHDASSPHQAQELALAPPRDSGTQDLTDRRPSVQPAAHEHNVGKHSNCGKPNNHAIVNHTHHVG